MTDRDEDVRDRLERAEGILQALHDGKVDAVVGREGVLLLRLREAEAALRGREQRLELALESGGMGLWDLNRHTGEIVWNGTLYDLLGRDPKAPVSEGTFLGYVHPDDLPRVRGHVEQWFACGGAFADEFRIVREDGQVRWLAAAGRRHRDEHGRPVRFVGVNFDVTARREAEEAVRRADALYRTLAAHLPAGAAFILDRDLRYVLAAGAALQSAGFTPEYFEGRTIRQVLGPETACRREPLFRRALAGQAFRYEHESHGRQYVSRGVPVRNADGDVTHVLVLSYDITERKEMEEALARKRDELERRVAERTAELRQTIKNLETEVARRELAEQAMRERTAKLEQAKKDLDRAVGDLRNEVRYRLDAEARAQAKRDRLFSVLNLLPGYAVLKGRDYGIRFASRGFVDLFSQPGDRRCYEVQYGLDAPCDGCPMGDLLAGKAPSDWEETFPNGKAYHVWALPFRDDDGAVLMLEFGIDTTDRRKLERLVSEMDEAERRRIGRDLHDTLGQTMTGLGYLVGGLADRIAADLPEEGKAAEQATKAINDATAQVRALAQGLNPVALAAGGLTAALRELAERFEPARGVPCQFRCDGEVALDESAATHLYRIAQEATNNAAKHAHARRIELTLRERDGVVELRVADDGVGLPEDVSRSSGMGLRVMRHRAGAIGGRLRIRSPETGGTVVTCRVPQPRG